MTYRTTGTRVLYTGPYWPGSDIVHIAQALEECGVIVRVLDETGIGTTWRSRNGRAVRRLINRWIIEMEWNYQLRELAIGFKPDLVFISNAHYCWPNTLEFLRAHSIPTLCFYHDPQWLGGSRKRFLQNIERLDLVLTTREWQAGEFKSFGANKVKVIRFGFDPRVHRPLSPDPMAIARYGAEIAFIGTYHRYRANELNKLVKKDFPYSLRIWGSFWDRQSVDVPMLKYWEGRYVHEQEIPVIYSTNKIGLNWVNWEPDSQDLALRQGDQHTPRSFQIPACGGAVMIAQRTDEHKRFFEEDVEAVYFDTVEELREKLDYWLEPSRDALRRQMAALARERCLKEDYTYVPVFREVLQYMGLAINNR